MHYRANITAGALLIPESRIIARLLLKNVNQSEWKQAIENKNVLQKKSLASAKRIASLIRARLDLMGPELWKLVAEGNSRVAAHAVFACAIKHCRFLGDYLDLVVREQFNRLEDRLYLRLWDEFVQGCKQRDPEMPDLPISTSAKMRSNIHKILTETGYLKDSRSLILRRVDIAPEVVNYLKKNNEEYVLGCIQL